MRTLASTTRRPVLQRGKSRPGGSIATDYSGHIPQIRHILQRPRPQAKLTVSRPDDPLEREADRVADQVMRMPEPKQDGLALMFSDSPVQIHRVCAECEEELQRQPMEMEELKKEDLIQRKAGANSPGDRGELDPTQVTQIKRLGGGQPLPEATRAFFEPRFGHDFSHVRVHTDTGAAKSAQAVNASAYTIANHIVFGKDKYSPKRATGKQLLAHELTHVIQQSRHPQPIQRKCNGNDNKPSGCVNGEWRYEYDGCSVPKWVAFLFGFDRNNPTGVDGLEFGLCIPSDQGGRACDRHDECYQTCGSDQRTCDSLMLQDMLNTCNQAPTKLMKLKCKSWANIYYGNLRLFGKWAWSQRQSEVCGCLDMRSGAQPKWLNKLGPLLDNLASPLQLIWRLIFRMRKLTQEEMNASQKVHPPGMIPYDRIRVDENSLISKIGGDSAVTSFHVLHYPKGGISLDTVVHELTHVAQFEHVGSLYIVEALHAQAKYGRYGGRGSRSAYDYERTGPLSSQREAGVKFKDLNRESQAQLVQDYYLCLTGSSHNTCSDMVPFIQDMQRGEF